MRITRSRLKSGGKPAFPTVSVANSPAYQKNLHFLSFSTFHPHCKSARAGFRKLSYRERFENLTRNLEGDENETEKNESKFS
jgi:hypothetical protein